MQSKVTIYGIKTCNSMKKAFEILKNADIEYEFVDYKKQTLESSFLESLTKNLQSKTQDDHGLANIINTRGTTYRKLSKDFAHIKNASDISEEMIINNPSIIKRPLVILEGETTKIAIGLEQLENLIRDIKYNKENII
ncbi:hypothetical protein LS73_004340 [Helicobacter muridarum]|uniref:Arsenate reductase n=1 Tax=Helicobacter muridarum TaxID=216 RepID=A0A099TYV4_9HELI|nr:ArsC/Spx/MgsR family protein [Helicobacter muridarum]TLE00643.1 hypothetical protein LS73_004340 [Helicobacter muridarum]STQ85662.1 arsenate reductase [Helicobacter muridarum]